MVIKRKINFANNVIKNTRFVQNKFIVPRHVKDYTKELHTSRPVLNVKKNIKLKIKFNNIVQKKCVSIIAGLKSVQSQHRRSKGENYFAELCEINYGNKYEIIINPPIFNGYDADIVIKMPIITKNKKYICIAIEYRGIFHYKKVFKDQSLKQTQNRDKYKEKIIKEMGYLHYVVKDLGSFDISFVEEEFYLFQAMINEISI